MEFIIAFSLSTFDMTIQNLTEIWLTAAHIHADRTWLIVQKSTPLPNAGSLASLQNGPSIS